MKTIFGFRSCIFFLFGCLMISLTACVTITASDQFSFNAKSLTAPEGKSLVYFIRPSKFAKNAGFTISEGNREVGMIYGTTFVYDICEPGKKIYRITSENNEEMIIKLATDSVHYVEVRVEMGWWMGRCFMDPVSTKIGNGILKECMLSKRNSLNNHGIN